MWDHYTDYLAEATHKRKSALTETINAMKNRVAEGCTPQELKN